MAKKPKTPSQIAKEKKAKRVHSFNLITANVEALYAMAEKHKVPASTLVDEAISFYLEYLKEQNGKNGNNGQS